MILDQGTDGACTGFGKELEKLKGTSNNTFNCNIHLVGHSAGLNLQKILTIPLIIKPIVK